MNTKRATIVRWRERGAKDRRMRKKPVDMDTLRAVGGEVAYRAYMDGYSGGGRSDG